MIAQRPGFTLDQTVAKFIASTRSKLIDPPLLSRLIVRPLHLSRPSPPTLPQALKDSPCESSAKPERPVLDADAPLAFEWDWGVNDAKFWDLGTG
jgi:hypothetical protein